VDYDQFVNRVAERAGVSPEHAKMLTQATLQVLSDRISGGQAADLEAVLSDEKIARPFRRSPQKPADKFGFDEFVQRVRGLAPEIPEEAVLPAIRAVLLTLKESVPDKEFQDTMAQLPHEFRDLLREERRSEAGDQTAGAAASAGGPTADILVQRIAERAGVSVQKAVQLAQATLGVLRDRIGGQPAHDLAQRLPDASAEWLDEPVDTPAQDYGADDFVSRIRNLAPEVADDDVTPGIQAVMISLRDAVGDAELEIALEPLSDDYAVLVRVS
jgi:uncharacterized protein (DUF2267 family)